MAYRTGHRKFRLSHRKNEERKKSSQVTSLEVSISLNEAISIFKVSVPLDLLSYKVSLPLSAVTESPVRSLATLHSQTKLTKALPAGKQDVVGLDGVGSHLTYCKLALDSPCGNPRVSFTLRINDKFTWVLLVGGYQILPSDSALLSGLPSPLVTVSGVVEVLERVDSLKVCPGNADEKFSSLRSFRKGMFSAGETRTATVEHNTLGHSTIHQADVNCYWRIAVH